ncbi:14332_t:CDS:1, partial [Racocetra persica]
IGNIPIYLIIKGIDLDSVSYESLDIKNSINNTVSSIGIEGIG